MDVQGKRAYQFVQVDVFTNRIFGGNPLAVFLDGQGLSVEEMALIAKEMNLSETTFILPPTIENAAVRVRIFTPGMELPFAGHPTIGTTYVLATHGLLPAGSSSLNLEEGIGPVPVRLEGDPTNPDFIWMSHPPARFEPWDGARADVARSVGLTEADLLPNVPIEVGMTGSPFLYVALPDRATVDRAVPNSALISELVGPSGTHGVFVFAAEPENKQLYSRMFASGELNIPEDPATGAASGPLAPFAVRHKLIPNDDQIAIVSEQGTKMGRQSFIHIRLTRYESGAHDVEIGGSTVPVFEGTLYL